MTIVDDRILEYVRENEHGSPSEMKDEGPIRYSRQHIARRSRKLADRGLLRHVGNGVYVITDRGERYLDGDLDTEDDAPEEEVEADADATSYNEESANHSG